MRPQALSAMAALFVLAAAACAQVKGPTEITVPVGRLAAIPLTIEGDEADYAILGSELDGLREYDPDPKKLRLRVIGYSPGTAFVVVTSAKGGKLQPLFVVKVTVQGQGPQPQPVPPGPGPTPDPPKPDPTPPVAGKLFVVVVEETRQAMAERGAWFADKELSAYMKDKGHKFRVVDKDVQNSDGQTPADVKRFIDDAKKEGTPRLYLVGEDGKTRRAGPMAKTPAELLSLIKQHGG